MNVLNPVRRVRQPSSISRIRHIGGRCRSSSSSGRRPSGAAAARPLGARRLSARAVRRHAPARHDRARHDLPARLHHRRRADDRARRRGAEGRARHDPRDPARDRLVGPVRHPRHGACTPTSDRPARHHVCGAAGRGGPQRRRSSASRCIPTRQHLDRQPAAHRRRRAAAGAWKARPPNLADPPPGCRFHPRCPLAMDICRARSRPCCEVAPGHRVACFAVSRSDARMSAPLLRRLPTSARPTRSGGLLSRRRIRGRRRRQLRDRRRPAGDLHDHRRIRQRQDDAGAHDPEHRDADRAARIRFRGIDLATHPRPARSGMAFMRQVQPIFQNPFEAFNPLKRVDRYLFLTRRGASSDAAPAGRRRRRLPTRRCARSDCRSPRSAAAFRTSCPAASCSASRSPAR